MTDATSIPPRPKAWSKEIVREACRELMPEVCRWLRAAGDTSIEEGSILDDLAKHATDGGYEFAKNLDNYSYWVADAELVEILDSYSTYTVRQKAVKDWVATNSIVVPYAKDQRGTHRKQEGFIRDIQPATAELVFTPDAEAEKFAKGGGYIIAFEDFTPAAEPPSTQP